MANLTHGQFRVHENPWPLIKEGFSTHAGRLRAEQWKGRAEKIILNNSSAISLLVFTSQYKKVEICVKTLK